MSDPINCPDRKQVRIAVLGYVRDDNHPYSWSAIINGFDPDAMARCPAAAIHRYLCDQPPGSVGIPFARVTHLWTDRPEDAANIAAASLIPNIVDRPENVLGEVDAVIIATDDGDDHVRRVAPFLDSGLPIFVDKPLASNLADLRRFIAWREQGAKIISSSGLRYAPELRAMRGRTFQWLTGTTCKTWKRYGIHALEPMYTLLGPGFESVRARKRGSIFLMEATHKCGALVSAAAMQDAYESAFVLHGYSDCGHLTVALRDNYSAFRAQLLAFLEFVAGLAGEPHPFDETVELMTMLIAAELSADRGGSEIVPASLL